MQNFDSSGPPRRRDVAILVFIALAISIAMNIDIGLREPAYFSDYRLNANPDARHYVLLGHNFWEKGAYSREARPPYTPDVLRTPVYPLIVGGLDNIFGAWSIYAFQSLCRTATAVAVYWLSAPIFGRRIALLAGLIFVGDLMTATLDFEAMSESLYTLLATLAVLMWLRNLFSSSTNPTSWKKSAIVGLLLGIAILTRPTGLYLPAALAGLETIAALRRRRPRILLNAAAMLCTAGLLVTPWIVRNAVMFDVPRLTTADTINLIYFACAGTYSIEHGVPRAEAQEMIRHEYRLESVANSNNHWYSSLEVKDLDAAQRAAAWDIIRRHPGAFTQASFRGVAKAMISHNVGAYAQITKRSWNPPGLDRILRLDWNNAFVDLRRNSPLLLAMFFWQTLYAGAAVILSVIGAVAGLRNSAWRGPVACVLVVMAYYSLTIAVVGLDAYARHRSMLIPFLCLLSAIGIECLLQRRKRATPIEAAVS